MLQRKLITLEERQKRQKPNGYSDHAPISLVPRSHLHARLRRNVTISHSFHEWSRHLFIRYHFKNKNAVNQI